MTRKLSRRDFLGLAAAAMAGTAMAACQSVAPGPAATGGEAEEGGVTPAPVQEEVEIMD